MSALDEKRFSTALKKFAKDAAPLEAAIWKQCATEFGHKWISTCVEVRRALVLARMDTFTRRLLQPNQVVHVSYGDVLKCIEGDHSECSDWPVPQIKAER